MRTATDGQLAPWSISHYLNRFRDQPEEQHWYPNWAGRGRYKQAARLAELLESEMS